MLRQLDLPDKMDCALRNQKQGSPQSLWRHETKKQRITENKNTSRILFVVHAVYNLPGNTAAFTL